MTSSLLATEEVVVDKLQADAGAAAAAKTKMSQSQTDLKHRNHTTARPPKDATKPTAQRTAPTVTRATSTTSSFSHHDHYIEYQVVKESNRSPTRSPAEAHAPAEAASSSTPSAPSWAHAFARGEWDPTSIPPIPLEYQALISESERASVTSMTKEHRPPSTTSSVTAHDSAETGVKHSSIPKATDDGSLSYMDCSGYFPPAKRNTCEPEEAYDFFKHHGFLPGMKSPFEQERLRILTRYQLVTPTRKHAIDKICRIANTYFKIPSTVSLIFDDKLVGLGQAGLGEAENVDESGADQQPALAWPIGPSLCEVNITRVKKSDKIFIVPDITLDWRFKGNPYAKAGLRFYAAATIHLPTLSKFQGMPASIPVGSMCLVSDQLQPAFTAEDERMLCDLSSLVAEQLTLGYETLRRDREHRQTEFLGAFLERNLVKPLAPPQSKSDPSAASTSQLQSKTTLLKDSLEVAAHDLLSLTGASSAVILDLRSFRVPLAPGTILSPINDSPRGVDPSCHYGKIFSLGSSGDLPWTEFVEKDPRLHGAVSNALTRWFREDKCDFYDARQSPFAEFLPEHVTATTFVPVPEVDGIVSLMLILTSSHKHVTFEPDDLKFAGAVGSALASALLRERAELANQAKLAFVSQVSHELRTPVFAVASQIELLREFSTPLELQKISPMLDVADVCLESLRDVLDDTLDVAKFSNSNVDMEAYQRSAMAKTDLAQLAGQVAQACFIRKQRASLANADRDVPESTMSSGRRNSISTPVELILEVEEREGGWLAWVDVGGVKRVLLNLLGNSLKFTDEGHVKVTLKELTGPTVNGYNVVVIDVEDTGKGMSEEFIRSGSLFTPFVQENPFSNGAGLGMNICSTIVKRMGGSMDVVSAQGEGTTVRVTLPLDFASPTSTPNSPITPRTRTLSIDGSGQPGCHFTASPFSPSSRRSSVASDSTTREAAERAASRFANSASATANPENAMNRRSISNELLTLFESGSGSSSIVSVSATTPFAEGPGCNFSEAIAAAQAAAGPTTLRAIPTKKRKSITGLDLLVGPSSNPVSAEPALKRTRREPVARSKLRVLVADDNAIARNILAKMLQNRGVDFVAAVDGEDAVQKYRTLGPFHLLLVDVQMPRKDGIEAAAEIRQIEQAAKFPPSRIIALSGLSHEVDMRRAGVLDGSGPVDQWIVKGNTSLKQVIEAVTHQRELVEKYKVLPDALAPSPPISPQINPPLLETVKELETYSMATDTTSAAS